MTASSSDFYYTGTGWPPDDHVLADHDLLLRAFLFANIIGEEATNELREQVGVPKASLLIDACPVDSDTRAFLHSLHPSGLGHLSVHELASNLRFTVHQRNERDHRLFGPRGGRCCLYRFLDDQDRLLYVGISWDPDVRERQHRASQRWAPLISQRVDEWYDDRREAERAELAAIRDESPLFNEAGRPRLPALSNEVV